MLFVVGGAVKVGLDDVVVDEDDGPLQLAGDLALLVV